MALPGQRRSPRRCAEPWWPWCPNRTPERCYTMQRKGRVAQRCRYLRLCRGAPCPRHSPDLWRRNGHGEKLEGPWDSFLPADATIAHGASGRVPYAIRSGPCGGEQVIHQWRPSLLSLSLQFEMSTRGGAQLWRGVFPRRWSPAAGIIRLRGLRG
jgi:hypothetical protein